MKPTAAIETLGAVLPFALTLFLFILHAGKPTSLSLC